jgi:hypothetical protein
MLSQKRWEENCCADQPNQPGRGVERNQAGICNLLVGAYSGDVISTFRRDVNSHSDDVNKVGAQRR